MGAVGIKGLEEVDWGEGVLSRGEGVRWYDWGVGAERGGGDKKGGGGGRGLLKGGDQLVGFFIKILGPGALFIPKNLLCTVYGFCIFFSARNFLKVEDIYTLYH